MSNHSSETRYSTFILIGLGAALIIAAIISPFASSAPDGLERVAEDLGFTEAADPEAPAQKLPSASVFEGYALRGVPAQVATPIAGVVGVLATFGVAWGMGKLLVRKSGSSTTEPERYD